MKDLDVERLSWIVRAGPKSSTDMLRKEQRKTEDSNHREEGDVKPRQRRGTRPPARDTHPVPKKLGRREGRPRASGEHGPQHLACGLLASAAARDSFAVQGHPPCGHLWQRPQGNRAENEGADSEN